MAQHRGRRGPRALAPVFFRIVVPLGLTMLVLLVARLWYPVAFARLSTFPATYSVLAVAALIIAIGVAIRIWTGSDLAAFLAGAALPMSVVVLVMAVALIRI